MFAERILKLTRQLYPSGRAFKLFPKSFLEGVHKGLAESEAKAYRDAVSILDSSLPDNDNFSSDDATDWERRLGMISNDAVPLVDRKLAIKRKLAFPGERASRQHWTFLEGQLQAAGFNVFVFENRFDDGGNIVTKTDEDLGGFEHGEFEHGEFEHGEFSTVKCVNNIAEILDVPFDIGANYRSTFYIGSANIGTKNAYGVVTSGYPLADPADLFADVPLNRKDEFRQLILKIKPTQTVALLFINYV